MAAASEIGDPRARQVGPDLSAAQQHPIRSGSHARFELRPGIVGDVRDGELVDPHGEGKIGLGLGGKGIDIETEILRAGGQGFGRSDFPAVDMADRGDHPQAPPAITLVDVPELALGNVKERAGRHEIDRAVVWLRPEFPAAVFVAEPSQFGKVLAVDHLLDGGSPVVIEAAAQLFAADQLAGGHQQPGQRIVATALLEFLPEARRPVLAVRLPAVKEQLDLARLASRYWTPGQDFPEVAVKLEPRRVAVQFVAFKAVPGGSYRMHRHARGGMAQPDDFPGAGRRIPFQPACRIHAVGERDDRIGPDRLAGADLGKGQDGDIPVIVPFFIDGRTRQHGIESVGAGARGFAPGQLLHRQFRGDPRTARGRIAGTGLKPQIEIPVRRFGQLESDQIPPVPGEDGDMRQTRLGRADFRAAGAKRDHRAADPGTLHGLQIGDHSLSGGIIVHEPPPEQRPRLFGR